MNPCSAVRFEVILIIGFVMVAQQVLAARKMDGTERRSWILHHAFALQANRNSDICATKIPIAAACSYRH